jgi:putative nucleotidyltransferase with HDIG domain
MEMSRFIKTHVDDLKLGMFIAELDRPWVETPFLFQGFMARNVDELATLRELCTYVYVDKGLSRIVENPELQASHGGRKRAKVISRMFRGKTLVTYEDVFTFDGELGSAEKVFRDYEFAVRDLYDKIHDNGRVDMAVVTKTVNSVVQSIMRNPDACMLLTAIRDQDSYTYSHAMASSILASAVGRQIGLPLPDIKTLATGALLCDVGKLNISSRILTKSSPLTDSERKIIKEHVAQSLFILEQSPGVTPEVVSIVEAHHERHNGSGYPKGLSKNEIPPFARIVGIVDTYDAMISDRAYANGVSPADAISKLYTMRDVDFQGELVEEFIQSIGIYPAGSLVELTDGRVGMVVAEHRRRRLRPNLLIILDSDKNQLQQTCYLNLLEETEDAVGRPLEILKGVDPGEYGFDPEELTF